MVCVRSLVASTCTPSVSYPLKLASVSGEHAAIYQESLRHPERFWGELARTRLRWIKEFDQVMDCDMERGEFKWFGGGVINVSGERRITLRFGVGVCFTSAKAEACGIHCRTVEQIHALYLLS